MNWTDIAVSINSLLLGFLFIDYMRFRFTRFESMDGRYQRIDMCKEKHVNIEKMFDEIKKTLDKISNKLDER